MFEVLAEPNRRRILDLVRDDERAVGDLVSELGMSQPAVSKHLRVLRDAGLVEVRVDGPRRLYRLRPEPLQEIDEWLTPYRAAWRDRLTALERHLDEMPDEVPNERAPRPTKPAKPRAPKVRANRDKGEHHGRR